MFILVEQRLIYIFKIISFFQADLMTLLHNDSPVLADLVDVLELKL